jgi:tetratricopeptide (TPR) repeat protein
MVRVPRVFGCALFCALIAVGMTGCGSSVADWIVQTRNHQGDVAFEHLNYTDASTSYQLALKIDPGNEHARAGLVNVQIHIAQTLYANAKLEDAIVALGVASKYSPGNDRVAAMRAVIEQAEIKRDIVVSNYPLYKLTSTALHRAYTQLAAQNAEILKALDRFDYTYDTGDLGDAIRQSYALNEDVTRLTARLNQYRQLVESGVPEHGNESLAPPASLLPLP